MKNIILLLIVLIGVFVPKAYSQTYNMSSTTVNTCSGTFYDPGGTANYGNSQNYTMTFCSSTPGDEIQISFSSFDIESGWDYLTVNDGASSIQYTGTNSPGVVTSTGGCITFTFTSDGSVTYPGWVASISCVPSGGGGGGGNVVMTSGTWNGCSGTFMDPGGTGNYANSQNITMTLCSDQPGQQISLDFTTFNIESNFDYLYIDDGSGALQYTGSTLPPLVTSLNGCITLQFTSDGSVTYAGWEATIYCGTPSCTDGIQNQGETGIDCGGPNCAPCPDCYNGIQDGNETGIDCGGTCPTPCSCYDGIQNNGETDIDCGGPCNPCPVPCNVTATYTIGGPQPPVLDYNMSNGTISTCSGTFYDPGGTGNYANSTSLITQTFCSDQPGEQIILDFTGLPFQVETSFDFLNIYDGVGTGGTNLWNSQTQGGSTNPGVIQSTTGCLTITFSSDGSVTYSGWQAAISCTNPPLPMLDCNGGDITLVAEGQGEYNYLMNNDFNSGSGQGWNYTGGATFSQPCGPGDGSPYYWASTTTGTPQLTTVGFDVSCGGQIVFDMAYATQGGASPCEGPDLPNEGVTLQYSTDGGTTWTVIQYWDPLGGYDPNLTTWNTYTIPIPPGAVGPNTMFEWIQTNSSGTCCDNWGVDNVQIQAPINCAPYVYDWWQVPGGNNNPSQTETVTSTTTFNVTYTNGTDSCSTSVTVVVPPGTTADAGPDQTLCYGSAGVTIGGNPVSPDEGATYSWDNGAGSGTVDLTNPGIDNGQVVVSPAVTTTYILTVTFNGCTTTDTVTVYVDMPPTASNPPNINVECTADIPAPDPTVVTDEADDYTIPPTVTWLSDVSDGLSCPETITRTYRVTDGCGNYVDVTQLIIVNDITPPVLAAAPGPVTVECIGDVPAMTNLNWTDNCDGTGSVAGTDGALTGGPCGGTITRTWTYTDACGNTTTATQTITVNDQTAPVFAAPPGNVTVECIGDVPAMTNLNWTDNCDGTGSVAGTDGALTGGPCGGTITRTWTYTDACGNNATVTQTITVNDQTAPVFAAPPADVTVECIGDVPAMTNLTWTDNCDGTGSVAGTDGALTGGSCGGTITRTWTYTDACGNNATVTQTITVNDQTAPVFAAPPANVTVECIGDVPAMTNLTWTDNCDGTGSVAGTDGALTGGSCGGTITRTWTYTDACGNNATVTQTITVNDQTAPVFAAPPATVTVECSGDVPAMTDLGWTDNCDGSGVVTGTDVSDGLSCPETITRTWTYTDACGNTASVSQTIVVDDTTPPTASNPTPLSIPGGGAIPGPDPLVVMDEADNCTTNPTVVWVSDVSDNGNCPETITRTYSITDDCGNQTLVTQTITIGDAVPPTASNPADINVECAADVPAPDPLVVTDEADNGGVPTVTFVSDVSDGLSCPETITRTYQVTDNCGNFIYVTQNIIIQDITPPAFTAPPADITVECIGDVPAMTNLTWTDNCDGTGSVAGTDGALTGGSCGGTITRTWTYTDACGNNATVSQTITVMDITAPVFAAPPAAVAVVECIGDVPAMTDLSWTDNCDGTGVVTGTDGALTGGSCGGTITRTWTYTDACGNNATVTQTITVNDQTAPVFAAPPATVTVECSGDVPAMTDLGWTDNCDGSGVVTGTDVSDGLSCPETITRTWTYTDACGNTASVSQTIVVDDTTPPTASNPATTTVPGGPAPAPDPNVVIDEADNCTTNPVVAFVSEVSDNNPCPETITRTYSVTDDCGNQITVTHTILITDPFPPTGTAPADITVECIGDVPPADPNLITDEADNNGVPTVAWVGDVSDGLSCPETITRTYSITDACGNVVTVDQLITVIDQTAPVMAAPPAAVAVECIGDVPAMIDLGWTDNCDGSGVVTGADVSDGLSCPETITRTWTYTDACGNTASVSQTITVMDITAPVFAAPPAAVAVECIGDVPAMTDLSWTDNCDGTGVVTGVDGALTGGSCGGTITRTWTYTDACGNNATVTQTITVNDQTAPVFAAPPATVTVECSGDVPAMTDLGWTDNCDGSGVVTGSDVSDGLSCPETITRTWTYTDACGNTASVSQTIVVDDTTPPTASNPATTTVPGGPAPAPDPNVVIDEADNCTTNPVVAFVSEVSDNNPCPETITRTYSVTDDCGNQITVTHTILITDPFPPTGTAPADITVECIGDVPAADPNLITDEADNNGVPTVAWVGDVSDGLSCPETITRTYSITDACGNVVTVDQLITVIDQTAPVMAAPPAALAVECIGDVPVMIDLGWTDNCDGSGVVTGADVSDGLSCPETITRTWTYTDACGNTASVSQTITVMDITAPVFAAPPAAVTVECIGDVPAMTDLSWTDNCDGTGVVTGVDGALTGGSCGGTITRTWTYTDACGNNATVTQTITVNDQTAPVFAAPPATVTVECSGDVPAMTDLGWTDNCDGSGVVTGTDVSDGLSCPETITRTWTYTDACGNTASVSQTIVVDDTTPPTASNPATTTVPGGPAPAPDPNVVIDEADNCTTNPVVAFVSEVSDNNPCPETITRTYSITDDCGNVSFVTHDIVITDPIFPTGTAPANITVECIGDVPPADPNLITDEADNQGTPTVAWVGDVSDGLSCPETITRTYSITDICGNEITVDQLIVVNDTTDPTASNPVTINVECIGDVPVADINAVTDEADNCTVNPTVAWVGDVSDGLSCPETITRTFSVTDDCGNQITVDQLIIVNDITNPTASNPTTINVECIGDVPVADINAVTDEADNCTVNPTVAWVGDVSDGLSCPETITRTFSVTDDCGNSITVDQLIIVNDVTAPTASNPTTVNVECIGDVPAVDINVVTNETDNCTVNPIVAWVGDVSDGLSCPETITRTYSVTDDCGNQITVDQLIIVNDVTDPTASNPVTVNVECIADVPAVDINVVTNEADNCTANPVVAWVGDVSDGLSCPETITRTYSVTDDCGNQITVDQLIIVNDITDPTASNPLTVNVQCIGDVPAADINAVTDEADNCTVNPTVAWVGDISDGQSCPETITRTFSVTDDCGNQITVDQLIIVNDTIAPTASNPTTVNVECIGDVPASDPLVVTNEADNCTVNPVVAWVSDVSDGLSCPETITRTYSITDDCGNQTLVTQLIVVNDVTPPTASNPAPVSVPGAMDVPAPDPSVVDDEADNCTTNPVVTWVSDVSDGNVCNNEVITRTYSVVDDCGNETLVTQEITILAVPPPIDAGPDQLICIGESVTLTADNPWNVPITWDNGVQDGVQFSPTGTMTYTVTADNLGCISTDQVVVTVEDLPVVSFMADVTSGCEPLTVTFTNTSTASSNFDNCIWEFGDGVTSSGCGSVSYTYTNSGLFDVTLTTTTVNGCSNSITYDEYIYVEEIPIAAFTASQTELSTIFTEVHFENNSQYATDYTWNFGDMSPISTEENPTHSFPDEESGAYVVQLIATSPLGCADTAYTTIIVNEEIIFYVPNTFTPDDDTYNETFKPVFTSGYDPYDFTLLIFNRWGEIIWESHNAAVGWDGTYGGEVVQDGTYTWRIEFKTTMTDERKLVTGHVNVIR